MGPNRRHSLAAGAMVCGRLCAASCLVLLLLTQGPTPVGGQARVVSGDNCGSGADFPVVIEGDQYLGCTTFGGLAWCSTTRSTYVLCPTDLIDATQTADGTTAGDAAPEEPDATELPAITIVDEPAEQPAVSVAGVEVPESVTLEPESATLAPEATEAPDSATLAPEGAPFGPESGVTVASATTAPTREATDAPGAGPTSAQSREAALEAASQEVALQLQSTSGPAVVINEIMATNSRTLRDEDSEYMDWIELHNQQSNDINLSGWHLTDDPDDLQQWQLPETTIPANGFLVIFASGKDRAVAGSELHTNFKLKSSGDFVALRRPDNTVASALTPRYPQQVPDRSYGVPSGASDGQLAFLDTPTPGAPNSMASTAPLISGTTDGFEPQPVAGQDLVITTTAVAGTSMSLVVLAYRVDFEEETQVEMKDDGTGGDAAAGDGVFSATIPGRLLEPGSLIRWFVLAQDGLQAVSRSPPAAEDDMPKYFGTVVTNPSISSSGLPVLQWFTSDPEAAVSIDGGRGVIFYRGKLYDNVATRRRGVTALKWPKPKIKLDFKGSVFKYAEGMPAVEEINLQSFYEEPGEDTYMREPVAMQILREAGVPASNSFHIVVYQNRAYYGMFAFVEQVDETFLKRYGFSLGGSMFKSSHGELSNYRWDIAARELRFSYKSSLQRLQPDWDLLWRLTQGIAGADPDGLSRSSYLFDRLNLPEIINEMAVETMMLNQDRCTKNFYTFWDDRRQEWFRFPWDTESALGSGSGLRGAPPDDYCILACEQWNSPLYCNSEHPQDVTISTPFGTVAGQFSTGRKMLQEEEAIGATGSVPASLFGAGSQDFDQDLTVRASPSGTPGTYNHLLDAILDVPWTREMYLRRLRTVSDRFWRGGRIQEIIDSTYNRIRAEAIRDNAVWDIEPGAMGEPQEQVERGYLKLTSEIIPTRTRQLYEVYGPGSNTPLMPEAQPSIVSVHIDGVASGAPNAADRYLRLVNDESFAVDMSDWRITGSSDYTLPAGAVIPAGYTMFVSPDVAAFRQRTESPKIGERNLVVGGPPLDIPPSGWTFALINSNGLRVSELQQSQLQLGREMWWLSVSNNPAADPSRPFVGIGGVS